MKINRLVLAITVATALVAQQARAQQTIVNSVDARIQGGTLANTANLASAGSTPGYLEIKSGSSLSSGSRKSYFQFNVGSTPNTNANAIFTLVFPTITPNSQSQRVQLYALNQAYAGGFNPATMTWNNAQANNTNDNSAILTDPSTNTYTATPLVSVVLPTADSTHTTYTFTLQAGTNSTSWGNFIKSGNVTLALTGIPDSALNGNGPIRSPTNVSTLTFNTQVGGGPMPSISPCTNVSTYPTYNSPTNYFTVSPSGLTPTATSDNQAVVADADIHIEGSGANWKVYAVGGTTAGTANIVLTVTDGSGNPANANFKVTVNPVQPFFSSNPPDTNTLTGIALTVPFAVYEPTSNADNITIWATSLNTNLVADSGLSTAKVPGTGGTNRTVTITPLAGTNGIAPIALWASDGLSSNRTAFAVVVRPSPKIAFIDNFSYTTNLTSLGSPTLVDNVGSLYLASGGFWRIRGGATGNSLQVSSGQALVGASTTPTSATPMSLIAPLVGGPFLGNNDWIIYTSFKATWTAVPQNSGTMVHLYDPNSSGTVGLLARLSTSVSNSVAGQFRVRIESGENSAPNTNLVEFPTDLSVGTTYNIVTKYVVDATKTTLWVDTGTITEGTSTEVVSVDNNHTVRPVYDVGLRQGTDTGPLLIDDLKVTVVVRPSFASVTRSGSSVIILFNAGVNDSTSDFIVNGTAALPTPLAPLSATITSLGGGLFQATVAAVGFQGYYQLERKPMVFP